MNATRTKIILDANWWISIAIAKMRNKIFPSIILNDCFELYASTELDIEVLSIINKPHLKKLFQPTHYFEFLYYYFNSTIHYSTVSKVKVCRDPNDDYLLALAKDTGAEFIITGDKDLLILEKFENTIICSLTQFMEEYVAV